MSATRLTFWGGAGQVTGSMHLLEAAGARILLDAGLFQGRRAETQVLNAKLPFDARRIDGVVLSHSHIDHSGRLPLLVKDGFHGPIYSTPATRDLSAVMLADAGHIQEKDHEFLQRRGTALPDSEPLYTLRDAVAVQDLIVGVPYRRVFYLRKHLALEFLDAGHILGSATVDLRVTEGGSQRLVFSGDIGRSGLPIVRDPEPPSGPIDTLIVEATYANRLHESFADAETRLGETVRRVAGRGGKLMIPAYAVGRVQELVYSLHRLYRAGQIPEVPIYVDSPLAVDITTVFRLHPEVFDRRERMIETTNELFDFPLLRYVREVSESKALDANHGPAVIISASGMVEAGRILHHLAHGIGDHRNLVLFVGFQAEHTLGRRIQSGQEVVRILGQEYQRRAEVETISGYSA
ncbi:MAG TPA: MBL fold metallo-hydrolase, partial [Gemmatimonadales bacterium]|nr:MBL fold metallo-hydrolase [Gemmatimonadales bacterium]